MLDCAWIPYRQAGTRGSLESSGSWELERDIDPNRYEALSNLDEKHPFVYLRHCKVLKAAPRLVRIVFEDLSGQMAFLTWFSSWEMLDLHPFSTLPGHLGSP